MTAADQILAQIAAEHDYSSGKYLLCRENGHGHRLKQVRQQAMLAIRETLNWSYPQIGRFFGGMNHTTVMHGCREALRRRDPNAVIPKYDFSERPEPLPLPVRVEKLEEQVSSLRKQLSATTADLRAAIRLLDQANRVTEKCRLDMEQNGPVEVTQPKLQKVSGLRGW